MEEALQIYFQRNYNIKITDAGTVSDIEQQLTQYIDKLINEDFEKLVFLLYKIDIQEAKLKAHLQHTNENTAKLIAQLMIERAIEKYHARKKFKDFSAGADEERW